VGCEQKSGKFWNRVVEDMRNNLGYEWSRPEDGVRFRWGEVQRDVKKIAQIQQIYKCWSIIG
jgi:hypothetical protein